MRSWPDAYPNISLVVPWQILITDELRHRVLAAWLSKTGLARVVGMRHNTVTELYHPEAFHIVSVRTFMALAAHLGHDLPLSAEAPWV